MSAANPRHYDIPGAPFIIGQPVTVVQIVDETAWKGHKGRSRRVEYFE